VIERLRFPLKIPLYAPSACDIWILRFFGSSLGIYIYIIYTPNLGLGITLPGREREQGRFRGSREGARGSSEGVRGSSKGVRGSSEGARGSTMGQCRGAADGSLKWLPHPSA